MDCADTKRHLSEYMDGVLDGETGDRVEKHLSTCEACRKELESLKALVHDLETLPRVKAPDDFLEQLHERMDARFKLWGYLKELSRPFQMRIPLQIAAATAMAVLIFAVVYSPHFKDHISSMSIDQAHKVMEETGKETMTASAPAETKGEILSKPSAVPASEEEMDFEKQEIQKVREGAAARRPGPALKRPKSKMKRSTQHPAPMTAEVQSVSKISSPNEARPVELVLLLKKEGVKDIKGRLYDRGPKGMPTVSEKRSARSFGAADAEKLGGATSKDEQTSNYLKEDKAIQEADAEGSSPTDVTETRVLSPYEARQQLEAFITKAQGRILKVETKNHTDVPVYVDVEIPASQYVAFCRELNQVGTVQTPLPTISEKGQGPVQMRIRFVAD